MAKPLPAPQPCPIRGHNHDLVPIFRIVQMETGNVAYTWECPTGNYRWFALEGRTVSPVLRDTKGRWGWAKPSEGIEDLRVANLDAEEARAAAYRGRWKA